MIFAIIGRDPNTNQIGAALAATEPDGTRGRLFVRPGVGAVASLGVPDAPACEGLLDDVVAGRAGPEALAARTVVMPVCDGRQMGVLDAAGAGAFFTSETLPGSAGGCLGTDCVALGHDLGAADVVQAIVAGFEGTEGPLGGRLIAALDAGLEVAGDGAALESAGIVLSGPEGADVDLHIDRADDPILDLARAWGAGSGT